MKKTIVIGFTLIELLVVIAIISILAAILLPALGHDKQKAKSIQCLNNQHQLWLAWKLYLDDTSENLPFSASGCLGTPEEAPNLGGWLPLYGDDYPLNFRCFWDPDFSIKKSVLWPY